MIEIQQLVGETAAMKLGDPIYSQGDDVDGVYQLLSGKVRLYVRNGDDERTVDIIQGEQFFGMESFLLQEKACCSARATGDVRVKHISGEVFAEYLLSHPRLREELESLCKSRSNKAAAAASESVTEEKRSLLAAAVNEPTPNPVPAEQVGGTASGALFRLKRRMRIYPVVHQESVMDCGIACLAMLIQYYGGSASMKELRTSAGVTSQGTDLLALAETAERSGFISRGIKATFDGLLKARLPLVCHWDGNHYVVLYEMNKTHALIADPQQGLVEISKEEFNRHFGKYALELSPTTSLAPRKKDEGSLRRYLNLLASHKKVIGDIAVASLVVQILTLAMPLFTQVVIDRVLVHHSLSMLNIILVGMLTLILFQTLISAMRAYLVAFTAAKLDQSLFVQFFKHLISLPYSFFEERTTGDIISRLQENRKVQAFISGSAVTTAVDLSMAVLYLALAFLYNFQFGLWVVGYLAVFAILLIVTTPFLRSLMQKAFLKEVATNAYMIEAVRGIERIKAASAEHRTRWAWEELFIDSLNVHFQATLLSRMSQIAAGVIQSIGSVLLLFLGAHLVIGESLSIGQLMALILIVSRITAPLLYMIDMWDEVQDLRVALERLSEVLDREPEEINPAEKIRFSLKGDIAFENVTFQYSGNASQNAAQNLAFQIKAGQTIGIVGRSGCGKSTLLKLLQGLYLPDSGRILVDGHDIRHLSLGDLRKQIGLVSQQDYLFRGTISDTIAYYNPQASQEEIVEAAKLAGIHDFISTLPKGYQHEVAEGGVNMSGGQRQRLCIARAILHNPRVLLFDEATSFLDYESEQAIQASIRKLRAGRTVLIVAHRLSTIKDADKIFVMDRGQILEGGTHAELMAKKGAYYHLWSPAGSWLHVQD